MLKIDIRRWNYKTREYDPYEPDPAWEISLYSENMDEKVNCADCGKEMTYGEGYTSRELHTSRGMGYPVCEESYEKEHERETVARRKDL